MVPRFAAALLAVAAHPAVAQRSTTSLNNNWRFYMGEPTPWECSSVAPTAMAANGAKNPCWQRANPHPIAQQF